jgi:hypothetical protein
MALAHLPAFMRSVLVAALILGSHALHDTFSVIRCRLPRRRPFTEFGAANALLTVLSGLLYAKWELALSLS